MGRGTTAHEAEREKAARETDDRKYPWGDEEPDPERAVFRRSWGHRGYRDGDFGFRCAMNAPTPRIDAGE